MFLKKPRKRMGKVVLMSGRCSTTWLEKTISKLFSGNLFKFLEAIDNIQAQFFAAEFSARP